VRYMHLKNIRQGRFSIDILCLGQKGELGARIEALGYKVDAFNCNYGIPNLLTTLKLARYIRKNKYDIVHAALFHANFHSVLAAKLGGAKAVIIEEHGEHNLHWQMRHFIHRAIGRFTAWASDAVLCCSDFVKDGVGRMYGIKDSEKLYLAKNLVEDKRLELKHEKHEVRQQLNIPNQAPVIGTVSSLYWIKNQKLLLDALKKLEDKDIYLVLCGDGPLKGELERYCRKLGLSGRVRFLGWRSDTADILNSFDIFALPSLSEGLPVCLLEAMSIGLPCVASNVGGIPEVIENGVNGILIDPNSCDELAAAAKKIIEERDFAYLIASAARKQAQEYFNPERYIRSLNDLYTGFNGRISRIQQ